jgi:hypothetical protein
VQIWDSSNGVLDRDQWRMGVSGLDACSGAKKNKRPGQEVLRDDGFLEKTQIEPDKRRVCGFAWPYGEPVYRIL